MTEKLKLVCIAALLFFSANVKAQYREVQGAELESLIYQNHRNQLPGYEGLFNKLIFKVEDFSLLDSSFEKIETSIQSHMSCELIKLDKESQEFVVIYDKKKALTDDFLKMLKGSLGEFGVFLVSYEEFTLIRANN